MEFGANACLCWVESYGSMHDVPGEPPVPLRSRIIG
jgi:hypothetical protein